MFAPSKFCRIAALGLTLAATGVCGQADAQVPKLFTNGLPDVTQSKPAELVKADLLADATAAVAGKPFTVGVRLQMAPEWHTYWQYSGDAGLPTKIEWQLPDGFKAGPIQWPLPEKIVSPGDIINYGYSREVMLLVEITPPATLPPGDVTLKAKATWLVCRESCIPGSKELTLSLPVGTEAHAANAELFARYRQLLPITAGGDGNFTLPAGVDLHALAVGQAPQPGPPRTITFQKQADRSGKTLTVTLTSPGTFYAPGEFCPLPDESMIVDHPRDDVTQDGQHVIATVPVPDGGADPAKLAGVFVFRPAAGSKELPVGLAIPSGKSGAVAADSGVSTASVVPAAKPPAGGPRQTARDGAPSAAGGSLGYFLLLGFLGGLILNVMPCVLPVISLKLFSFVKQANQSRERVLRLGLAYAAGVFAWFLGFAALVVALKSAGHQVGYAFHLQNPWFLVGLSAVTFVFALNLLGVFEIILPGSLTGAAGEVAGSREGYTGAFLQGMLATVLGSACTAPLFGEALGFAFSQSGPVIFAVFAAIAAGMSAPFVLLAAQPGWMKFLPKPGAWMERVKQGTGFLLLGTMLWLLFSVGHGLGPDGVVWTGALLLVLGAACWVQGSFNTLVASDRVRWASRAAILAIVLGGGGWCLDQIAHSKAPVAADQTFAVQLDNALKTGRTVFVDFTAEWCVSCKVNERGVLDSDPVQKALHEQNAVFLKADFTTKSDDISRLLQQFNAPSVPLYVIYPAGKPDAPIVLPVLLTKQTVLDALAAAAPQNTATKPVAVR